uniref:TIL domain-containing protein n=1 Tax=Trichuris muris TaxID=70415 RepID=A0A5S6QG51_TRIMR
MWPLLVAFLAGTVLQAVAQEGVLQTGVLVWTFDGGTFIRGTYYDRMYKAIYIRGGCPTAVCEYLCLCVPLLSTGCPVYECNGFFLREPCHSEADCVIGGACVNSICHYSDVTIV